MEWRTWTIMYKKTRDNAQPKHAAVADMRNSLMMNPQEREKGGTIFDRKGAQPHTKGGIAPDVNR